MKYLTFNFFLHQNEIAVNGLDPFSVPAVGNYPAPDVVDGAQTDF